MNTLDQYNVVDSTNHGNNFPAAIFFFQAVQDKKNTYTLQFNDFKKGWMVRSKTAPG